MFGSTKNQTIIATVVVLVGIFVILRGHYIVHKPHHYLSPAQTTQ
jgi:hypothetical protein